MELGKKIKELRLHNNMTLDELSRKADVSISLLSMVERDRSAPTVKTLNRIVHALGTTVSNLCLEVEKSTAEESRPGSVAVVRRKDRKKLVLGAERARAHYELLTPDYRRKLQVMYVHFPAGKNGGGFLTHKGEECGVILEGRLKAYVGEQSFVLEEGDTIYLDSSIPHRWENIGEVEVRAYWINTPATF